MLLSEILLGGALSMALARRKPGARRLHNSNRSAQYACSEYQQKLKEQRILCSRTGNCCVDAAMVSLWITLKTDLLDHEKFATREAPMAAILEYV